MRLPPGPHVLYVEVCEQLARDVRFLDGKFAVQVGDHVLIAVAELLQDVLGPRGGHPYMQHEVDARHAAELGLPQLGDQFPGGGVGDTYGLRMNDDAHGELCI